jgi:two-component system, chemotaxis family, chemotaxis protein CheY
VSTVHALVIDDSRTMRSLLGRQLAALGYEVLQAANGQEALDVMEQAGADVPTIATIDWNMPVMDGLTFVQRVRTRPEWRSMSLMMVTTEAEYDQIVRALAAGAHEYLIKPFTPEAFLDKLQLLGVLPEKALS